MRTALAFLLAGPLSAAPVIAHYSAEIRRESVSQYVVHVSAKLWGGEWKKPGFTLGPFRTGAFEGCVACEAKPQGILQKLTPVAAANGDLELTYRIAVATSGDRELIPLAVPEIAGTAVPGSVEVTLLPGDGMRLAGDMFPVLTAAGDGRWTATMANMVNHVEFRAEGLRAAAPNRFGPREWSDIAVVLMIAGGLLVRALITRKARTA